MSKKYRYENLPDKSGNGVKKELEFALIEIAVYMHQTMGLPFDLYKEQIESMLFVQQLKFYLDFRNSHPQVFNNIKIG